MCGIVGLLVKKPALKDQLGALMVPMLLGMTERGPDSAGLAVFGDALDAAHRKLSLYSGLTDQGSSFDWPALATALNAAMPAQASVHATGNHAVLTVAIEPAGVKAWLREQHPKLHILSTGRSIDLYKDIGTPGEVAARYGFAHLTGTHLVGHTRMATESAVTPDRAHPFTAGEDFCLVHNGSLSNPYGVRRKLEPLGIHFDTDNDTEAEHLAGPDVDFIFRIEKLAKALAARALLSEPAAISLELTQQARSLGKQRVPDFAGEHLFYALATDCAPAVARRRVLLVEPTGVVSDALAAALARESDLAVVARAADAAAARKLAAQHRPELVLLDLALAEGDPLTLIRDLAAAENAPRLLVLSALNQPELIQRALRAGAHGAALKSEPTAEVLQVLRGVLAGGTAYSRRISALLGRSLAGSDQAGRREGPSQLSDRELEIFHLVAAGRQNRDIAEILKVSVKTVETHKENIKLKLGVASVAELAERARVWLGAGGS